MREERILSILNHVDEKFIKEADPMKKTKKKNNWLKCGSMAACFCLLVAGMLVAPNMLNNDNPQNPIDSVQELAYNITLEDSDTIYNPISFAQRKLFGIVDENATGLTEENTYQITSKDLGEVMGVVGTCMNEKLIGATVYFFADYPNDDSICIVGINGVYEFYVKEGIIGIIDNSGVIDAPVDEENYKEADPNAPVEYGTATYDILVKPTDDAAVDEENYKEADPNAPVEYGTATHDALANPIVDAPVDEENYKEADPNAPVEYGTATYDVLVKPIVDAPVDEENYQDADPNAPVEYRTATYDILVKPN